MTAQLAGFITRAQWGARLPKSVSRSITPRSGGCTKHYAGGAVTINSHADCVRMWKGWQNFHMDGNGWADIAYTAGYCQHGYAFAGRGYGVRTAANGTNAGNQSWYAFCWIGGGSQVPTREALDALDWLVYDARANGSAGTGFNNHRDHKATSCPGAALTAYRLGGAAPGPTPPKPPAPPKPPTPAAPPFPLPSGWYFGPKDGPDESVSGYYSHRADLDRWQTQMARRGWDLTADGLYGPETERITRLFQAEKRLGVDGLIGPKTWAAAWTAPVT